MQINTYFEINTDGIINTNELTETQIMMLNNGEDIVIIKNIDLMDIVKKIIQYMNFMEIFGTVIQSYIIVNIIIH